MSLVDLSNLPGSESVAIYGNGGRGQDLLEELAKARPRTRVPFFIDSTDSDDTTVVPTLSFDQFLEHRDEVDLIVIASQAFRDIAEKLRLNCIPNFVVFDECRIHRVVPGTERYKLPPNMAVFNKQVSYLDSACATTVNADFQYDPKFVRAFSVNAHERNKDLIAPAWRVHTILFAASQAMRLDGDFVECGVFRGQLSRAVIEYTDFARFPERTFYLLDTFQGIPEEQITEQERKLGIKDKDAYQDDWLFSFVTEKFSSFENVRIIRGKVPDTLPQVDSEAIGFLHIDMNVWQPEIAAIRYFWDKIVPGGIVILDDYGFGGVSWGHYTQKVKFDEFAADMGTQILSLPTGQGMMIKS